MGTITLPPVSPQLTTTEDLYLEVWPVGDKPDMASHTIDFCCLVLIPLDLGYRTAYMPTDMATYYWHTYGTPVTFVDDGWKGVTYLLGTGGVQGLDVATMFTYLTLKPGVTQQIHFSLIGCALKDNHYKVRVYYAPAYKGAV